MAWGATQPFVGQPADVVADGGTWVAGGWAAEGGPAAWTSTDAVAWTAATVDDPMPTENHQGAGLGSIVRLGDSLLSFGTYIGFGDHRSVVAWRSPDGREWEAIDSDSPLFGEGYLVRGLAQGDSTLVAVEGQFAQFIGRLWRWTEETSWVDTTPRSAGQSQSFIEPNDVIWTGDRFVAVGTRAGEAAEQAAVWTSADGETWDEELMAGGENVILVSVASLPDGGLVALGHAPSQGGPSDPRIFVTDGDGAWTAVDAFGGTRMTPGELLSVDGGVLAFGSDGSGTLVWSSADGAAWEQVGTIEAHYEAAAVMDDRIVVFTARNAEGTQAYVTSGSLDR